MAGVSPWPWHSWHLTRGHWAVSQQPVIILSTTRKNSCNAQRSRDPISPRLQIIFCTITRSVPRVPRLIWFSIQSAVLILVCANIGIVRHITSSYHISIFHIVILEDVMKDTKETNQCHPDHCHDVIKMTLIINPEMRFQPFHYFDERMSLLWQFPTTRAVLQS